jgi:hypothetical protein
MNEKDRVAMGFISTSQPKMSANKIREASNKQADLKKPSNVD